MTGQRHPLADIVRVEGRSFEDLMPLADVYLFDEPNSRVFCMALVTRRPVVYVDIGAPYFAPEIKALIDKRCTVIKSTPDDRGRPWVDFRHVEQAICQPCCPDPTALAELRQLLIGVDG